MRYIPDNTLAFYQSAPQYKRHDLGSLPTSAFANSTKIYRDTCDPVSPNDQALEFYTMNHLVSLVSKLFTPNEVLPEWAKAVLDAYLNISVSQGRRMFHYILAIATREMRHLKSTSCTSAFWQGMTDQGGVKFTEFIQTHIASANGGESKAYESFIAFPPDIPIGKYVAGLSYGFHKGKWAGGYGGTKWGSIIDAVVNFVHGKTSMEAMLDTGYTLEHNNAPMFDKGFIYSGPDKNKLRIVLDVQRSGQVPELILDKEKYGVTKTPLAEKFVQLVHKHLPNEFKGYVDWFAVEKLGALGSYASFKDKQLKSHPPVVQQVVGSSGTTEVQNIKITGEFVVYPNQVVQTFERVGAA